MSLKSLAQKASRFVVARAKERSTYIGLAAIAAALGAPELAGQIDQVGQIGQLLGMVVGGALTAATTS